jgi:methionyl-tRNA formyltransferase
MNTMDAFGTGLFPSEHRGKNIRIVFLGTPEFAVASLDALINAGYLIAGVVTAPDKPAGRGMKIQESAVKKFAAAKGLTILQPEKLKNVDFLQELQSLQADLQIIVAFRMLPEVVWSMPPMGTVNVHASLLPQYRGAAPINWAIINGEKETGVTTFKLQHEIDTGNILLQAKVSIEENETAGELHDKLKEAGADLLVKTVQGLADGSLTEIVQSSINMGEKEVGKHAPRIFTDTCRINWKQPVEEVYNLIRGLSPYPTAFTMLEGKTLKIFRSEKELVQPDVAPGILETDKKTFLKFAANNGYIRIKDLQLEGKKRMSVEDFLRGYRWADT